MDLLLCHHVPPPSSPPVSSPSSMSPCSFLPPEVFRVSLAYSASCREGWQTLIIYFTPCTFLENIFNKFLQNGLKGSRVQLRPPSFCCKYLYTLWSHPKDTDACGGQDTLCFHYMCVFCTAVAAVTA